MKLDRNKLNSVAKKVGSVVGLGLLSGLALATPPDTTAAVTSFTDAGTAIGAVGAAMVGAAGAGIVFRWVTAFLIK